MPGLRISLFCLAMHACMAPLAAQQLTRRTTIPAKPAPVAMNVKDPKAWVEAKINGQPVKLMLVPEVDFTRLSSQTAARLGIKPLKGYDNAALIPKLSVAGAELQNEPCILEDVPENEINLDGLLGHSTLREFAVRMNYFAAEFTLLKPDALSAPLADEGVAEMDVVESDVAFAGTKVSARRGGISFQAAAADGVILPLVPAGSIGGVPMLPESLFKKKFPAMSQGAGEIVKLTLKLGKVNLGDLEFKITGPEMRGFPNAGILTKGVLRHFDITLDYAGRRVRLGMDPSKAGWAVEGGGFSLGPKEGGWQVTSIKDSSPASRAGLQVGDRLTTVGNTARPAATAAEIMQYINDSSPAAMTFERRDPAGRTKEISVTWTVEDSWPDDPLIRGHQRDWTFPEDRAAVEVPVEVSYGVMTAKLKVNGHPFRCLVDTGASMSCLSPEAARLAGLNFQTKTRIRTSSGESADLPLAVADSIEAGPLVIRREPWGMISLPPSPVKMDGVLGLGTLRDFVIRMDWKAKRLTLWKRGTEPARESDVVLPVKVRESYIPPSTAPRRFRPATCGVTVMANGKEFTVLIDSGYNQMLSLPDKAVQEKLPILAGNAAGPSLGARGFSGISRSREGILSTLGFAGDTLQNLRVSIGSASEGILGAGILRHYAVTLDVDAEKIFLSPHGTVQEAAAGSTEGLALDWREGIWIVAGVRPGGPADTAGLKPGDVYLAVNGKPLSEMSEDEFMARYRRPPGTELKINVKRGNETLEFTLRTEK
ncbi:MAG TPA: aspartyl protease family protein [Verrucomicrobiales bacterium]|nr:aspartyl protease family protein [Verrucomicrobiales bacterium]